jgi:hypothetical protein
MPSTRLVLFFALSVMLVVSGKPGSADIIENGNFSEFDDTTGLPTGWDHFDGGGALIPPEYVVDGIERYMRFFERSQLEQRFDLPAEAQWLSFEYKMDQQGVGSGNLRDSFQATLYDPDFNPLLGAPFGFFTVDYNDTYFDPNYVSLQQLPSGWYRVTLDVASVSPMNDLLLEFLLNGFDDGQTTTVLLDNVSVSTVVPEPASTTLFAVLALCLMVIYRTRWRQSLKMEDKDRHSYQSARGRFRGLPAK